MRRIGFLVNPIAGMGGRVGLKGTDGMVEEARRRGAVPEAPARAHRALVALADRAPTTTVVTWDEPMGASEARSVGFQPVVVGSPERGVTTAEDTREAVRSFLSAGVDLILFVGGDGTAVDVAETLEGLDANVPVLGIPAGVKVFSSVFAMTPDDAGRIVTTYERTELREVCDIDEDAYREGDVQSTLRAVVEVPTAEEVQSGKQLVGGMVDGLIAGFIDDIEEDITYLLGPGGTVGAIKEALGFKGSPLGIDCWRAGSVLASDANEEKLLEVIGERNVIVVSPIGGQGFIFGRGNQQLSPSVIRRCDIEIIATRSKLDSIGVLRVDTGDVDLDDDLRGWVKVRVGRFERRMMQIV